MYLMKAIDAYPYSLEEALESLNYALSYEPNNARALSLMGKIQMEHIQDYRTAGEYFRRAMENDIDLPILYPDYVQNLLYAEEYEHAAELLHFAFRIKATDKARLFELQGQLLERQRKFREALESYRMAFELSVTSDSCDHMEDHIRRLKKKLPKKRKPRKKPAAKKTENPDS